jgi:hypothetical protein
VPHHLEGVPEPSRDPFGVDDELEPLVRPSWWRWVAVIVVLALVVATPFAYALYRLLD